MCLIDPGTDCVKNKKKKKTETIMMMSCGFVSFSVCLFGLFLLQSFSLSLSSKLFLS